MESGGKPLKTREMGEWVMGRTVIFILIGYLSGNVLYANVFGNIFGVRERYAESTDKNPGTANAYKYGGFWCGTLTLLFELVKGALPVYFYVRTSGGLNGWGLPLVMAAPVLGHIFPVFHEFHGGKGIAVTFGCLVGLIPYIRPLLVFAASFIFLSVIVKVYPHYYRTIAAYLLSVVLMLARRPVPNVFVGFLVIAGLVCLRMAMSREEKESLEVKLLWMR